VGVAALGSKRRFSSAAPCRAAYAPLASYSWFARPNATAIAIAGGPKLPSRLKDFRRFSRYDKLAVNFLSTVVLARVVGMNKFRS
jgi:hypothetical protein